MVWFNEQIWFNKDYTFNHKEINKEKFTAKFCENVNISIDHSSTFKNETKQNDEDEDVEKYKYTLSGFESVAMYNYLNKNEYDYQINKKMPSKPFRTIKEENNSKKGKPKQTKRGSLFYRKIYRDILINCGGSVVCMDFS